MSTVTVLKAVQAGLAALELMEAVGVQATKLQALREKARAENRDITPAELAELSTQAQAAIDAARNV
jgi:hypothetical protein